MVKALALSFLALVASVAAGGRHKNLIVDTDIFSDVDDTGALLIATTAPNVNLLAVNVNTPSSYSALAVSAILNHYGSRDTPVGVIRPLTNETFFDSSGFSAGEYASKVAYHWSAGATLPWGKAEEAAEPVALYRKVLAGAEDGSVTIVSIGFFDNLSALLNSTADKYSSKTGRQLVKSKVAELVVMGGGYPSGDEYNFSGGNASLTANVVNTWPGPMVFSGSELGGNVTSGVPLQRRGPDNDPVRSAYRWYTYGVPRPSWDPLTTLYAVSGLGELFEYGNSYGYNHVEPDGSNHWVFDRSVTNQHYLKLKVGNETASRKLDELYLDNAWATALNRTGLVYQ